MDREDFFLDCIVLLGRVHHVGQAKRGHSFGDLYLPLQAGFDAL